MIMGNDGREIIVTTPDELHRVVVAALHSVMTAPDFVMPSKKRLLSAKDIAEQFGIAKRTLEHWRKIGTGPEYTTVGGRVLYDRVGFEKFIRSGWVRPMDTPLKKQGRSRL